MSLATQNPYGRLDVFAYKLAERLIEQLEEYWGVPKGQVWAMIEEHVESGIVDIQLKKIPEPLLQAVIKVIEARRGDDIR